jgi:hypothetical protein
MAAFQVHLLLHEGKGFASRVSSDVVEGGSRMLSSRLLIFTTHTLDDLGGG